MPTIPVSNFKQLISEANQKLRYNNTNPDTVLFVNNLLDNLYAQIINLETVIRCKDSDSYQEAKKEIYTTEKIKQLYTDLEKAQQTINQFQDSKVARCAATEMEITISNSNGGKKIIS